MSDAVARRRFRATVAYDGTAYCGFQRQVATQPTVQQELERAIGRLASGSVSVTAAGRTDSGVHARGQIISFELGWKHDVDSLQRAVNAALPADIALVSLSESDLDFHPRYDARRRAYHYYLYNAPTRSPLHRLYSWHVRRPLKVAHMNEAARHLVGIHDFATFGQPPQGEVTIREIFRADWQRQDEMLVFHIEGNAFLYRMVRSIVGSLVAVGSGAWTVDDFVSAFEARDRSRAATTAPPQGLCLISVSYD
ncbi:MAG: tRNA pseudouridine(38-40) synthase TruA [Chloroflexota bacterium]